MQSWGGGGDRESVQFCEIASHVSTCATTAIIKVQNYSNPSQQTPSCYLLQSLSPPPQFLAVIAQLSSSTISKMLSGTLLQFVVWDTLFIQHNALDSIPNFFTYISPLYLGSWVIWNGTGITTVSKRKWLVNKVPHWKTCIAKILILFQQKSNVQKNFNNVSCWRHL